MFLIFPQASHLFHSTSEMAEGEWTKGSEAANSLCQAMVSCWHPRLNFRTCPMLQDSGAAKEPKSHHFYIRMVFLFCKSLSNWILFSEVFFDK